jgi:serine O-acetyltransferase
VSRARSDSAAVGATVAERRGLTDDITERLLDSYAEASGSMQHVNSYELPSMREVEQIITQCRALLFPGFVGPSLARTTPTELREYVRERLDELRNVLRRQLYRGLHHKVQLEKGTRDLDCPRCAADAGEIADRFLDKLVDIREMLALDVAAHEEGDPAATGTDEIIFCYPGVYVISVYRIAHALLEEGAKLIPRMMTELAHERVGIDIHPAATIGRAFFIDHGTGIVIGETTEIGDRVRIYQGVTLGAMSVKRGDTPQVGQKKRHPTIEDDVVIYSGATILGGETVVGRGTIIGGNTWVTQSIPPGSVVTVDGIRSGSQGA